MEKITLSISFERITAIGRGQYTIEIGKHYYDYAMCSFRALEKTEIDDLFSTDINIRKNCLNKLILKYTELRDYKVSDFARPNINYNLC